MTRVDDVSPTPEYGSLVGTWRRFGAMGPVYEILAFDRRLDDGDWVARIRVVESGEELDYTRTELLADPIEN